MTDFYKKSDDLSDFKSVQTIIINKKYLRNVSRVNFPEECDHKRPSVQWYPFTNSFYPFTEDVDIYSRVNHVLSTNRHDESLTTVRHCQTCACAEDGYSEKEAQLQYLTSKPTSFLILGKPGIGEQQLGKLIAEYWNCVYLEPESLIREEIDNDTDSGKCIEFNLRNGQSISADTVVKLLEKRVKSETAQHRGFLICGFPLIPNDLYEEDFLTKQDVFFEAQKICDDVFETVIEIGVAPNDKILHVEPKAEFEDEEPGMKDEGEKRPAPFDKEVKTPIDLGSETSNVCLTGTYEKNLETQLELVFSQFEKPFMIIYVVCGNADVVTKCQNQRFDVYSQRVVDLQLEEADRMIYTYYSQVPGAINEEVPEDFIEIVKNSNVTYNNQEQRILVDLPKDWKDNVVTLLDRYRQKVLPTVESYVLKHELENFIRVDGRISPMRMFHAVKQRLKVLSIQKVIVPEKFAVPVEADVEAQSPNVENFENLSLDECFGLLLKKHVPSSMFKWTLSDWGFKCPVLLHEGIEKDGDPNYAVHFMNKIFFLADADCCVKFRRNPRTFLLPLEPKPNYKICVMGPRCSGKTSVAKCLSYLFNCRILKYERMLHDFFKSQMAQYERELRSKAMERALEILNEMRLNEWRDKEKNRMEKVAAWMEAHRAALPPIVKIKRAIEKYENHTIFLEISSFPTKLSYREVSDADELDDVDINDLRELMVKSLKITDFPNTLALIDFEQALVDDQKICQYLPQQLQPIDPIMATPSDDFVCRYIEEAVQNASFLGVELTLEHKINVLLDGIKTVEEDLGCKGCWIVDGMLPKRELFKAMYPENTPQIVVLLKADMNQYEFRVHEHENFRKFFYEIGKEEASWRTPSLTGTYIERTAANVLEDLIDNAIATADPEEVNDYTLTTVEAYKKELEAFSAVQSILSENKIDLITVSITNKPIKSVMKEVVLLIENRYRQVASVFTELDRVQELEDMGEPDIQPEEEVDGEEKGDNEEMLLQNRRYGDTFHYCPVVFHDHFVLWKGKHEFTVKYDNKVYMLSSANAMNKFLDYPFYYSLKNPSGEIPPPRICIVGPYGSGKTSVAKSLACNLGLYKVIYENLLKSQIAPKSKMCFHEILKNGIGGLNAEKVRRYLTSNKALEEELLEKTVGLLWTEEYKKMHGFVLSGFPKRPSDVNFMVKHCTIPDIIIELSINQGEVRNRLVPKRLAELKMLTQKERCEEILSNWEEQYQIRFRDLLQVKKAEKVNASSDVINRPYLTDLAELDEANDVYEVPETEEMIEEIKNILSIELPKPEFFTEEVMLETYVNDLENESANELAHLRAIRDACNYEAIPWVTIDAGLSKEKVFVQAMRVVEKFKFRNRSLFERVYEISVDLSKKLLSTGYYFLSKFGKTCPVQVYDDYNPVQMYLPREQQFQLYPLVHRQYMYFLAGHESVLKFKQDPLKYISQKFVHDPLLPLKLAIIGPPKSGKTTLAERFKRDLGMQVISRGKACRYVLSYLKFSELAQKMDAVLRNGEELPNEIVMKAVDACSFDGRCVTQGFVLDGFPETMNEVRQLTANGLVLHLVIDLHADQPTLKRFCASTVGRRNLPPYSEQFIDHRYQNHLMYASDFRKWLDKEYQTNGKVIVRSCKWALWNECLKLALSAFYEVKYYHRYAFNDYALRLAYMQITPLEFIQRQSSYKDYCPCCLFFQNVLTRGGEPPDRTGLVQFRMHFYYLCHKHIDLFIKDPETFISPYNPRALPRDLPIRVTNFILEPYSEGTCIICYWTYQPKYLIRPGRNNFAVSYRETIYLFDKEECLLQFMRQPHQYFAIKITYKSLHYPTLTFKDLPIQGFLQQYDAQKLIKAITNTGILRPVIPGLDIATSACLNIALHLVINNAKTSPKYLALYKEAERKFHERRLNLINYLSQMKKMINPYLYYDEPMPKFIDPLMSQSSISENTLSTTQEVSVNDEDASQ